MGGATIVSDLSSLFRRELELCRLHPPETVMALASRNADPTYAQAIADACDQIGVELTSILVTVDRGVLDESAMTQRLGSADLNIVTAPGVGPRFLSSLAGASALKPWARTLIVDEPPDVLRRLFPTRIVRDRTLAGKEILDAASTVRIESRDGTDLTINKAGVAAIAEYGLADLPGRWDHWPAGQVSTGPVSGGVDGQLVINEDDILISLRRRVQTAVHCTIHSGRLVGIEGQADAELMREYFGAAGDDRAYNSSHFGWGADHRARWDALDVYGGNGGVMDVEAFYGNLVIAFGSTFVDDGDGKLSSTEFHFDVALRNHTVWVDEKQVLHEGDFVVPELV
jgi:2,5-dihydroxypyridine 5,6-dioxygenase